MNQPSDLLLTVRNLTISFGDRNIIQQLSLDVSKEQLTVVIGFSGSGKSTLLKAISRDIELSSQCKIEGEIKFYGDDIFDIINVDEYRKKVSYVPQNPILFPGNIYENMAIASRHWRLSKSKSDLDTIVEKYLTRVGLWNELKDRLADDVKYLSAGEKQRLRIAMSLSLQPDLLLLDEPTANLDMRNSAMIEELFDELRGRTGLLVITHSLMQAARISQRTVYLQDGIMMEYGNTSDIFQNPRETVTKNYITGRFG
jgi:phosphate transport system ATP-binding protein